MNTEPRWCSSMRRSGAQPADGVYYVRGDVTNEQDLRRAGIPEASAALVVPVDASNEADMRSILTTMAIESIAPDVRTVVEVNNPAHVDHLRSEEHTSELQSRENL